MFSSNHKKKCVADIVPTRERSQPLQRQRAVVRAVMDYDYYQQMGTRTNDGLDEQPTTVLSVVHVSHGGTHEAIICVCCCETACSIA